MLAAVFAVAGYVGLAVYEVAASAPPIARVSVSPVQFIATSGGLPDVAIETAAGERTHLSATDGYVRIATLFYSHCPGVCPMTIDMLRGIERKLSAEQRSKLHFVLLSLDPARDTPARLRALATERAVNSSRWLLGRTSAADVAAVAKAAHVQYRPLSDGSIDHSTSLVLLDTGGRVLARASDVEDPAEFVAAVHTALDAAGAR